MFRTTISNGIAAIALAFIGTEFATVAYGQGSAADSLESARTSQTQPPATRPPTGSTPPGTSTQGVPGTPRARAGTPSPTDARRPATDQANRDSRPSPFLRLASAPPMWGDRFGGGGLLATFQPPAFVITQTFNDGVPVPFFVTNAAGTPGAAADPTVPLIINNGANGQLIAMSVAPGFDGSGDQFPDTFPINQPAGLLPAVPGPGTLMFTGGTAVFVGAVGPNTITQPANRTNARGWNLNTTSTFTPAPGTLILASGGGDGIRLTKIAENNSPQPRDRVYFSYNFFNDVVTGFGDVNRYTVGVEKTFFCRSTSVDVRLPFAATLDADRVVGAADIRDTEVGNLAVIFKTLLTQGDQWLLTAGVGVTTPTARDIRLSMANGTQILVIDNESVHLLPYVALLSSPNQRFFYQSFVQLDLDTSGNDVRADVTGANLAGIGVLQEANVFIADLGIGYRLLDDPCGGVFTGVAPFAELHYTTTIQDGDAVAGRGLFVRSLNNRYDVLNLTLGTHFQVGSRLTVSPAVSVPLRDDGDEEFDYEAVVQVNLRF